LVKRLGAVLVLALAVPALGACSTPTPDPDDGLLRIVASTDVYGSIAAAVAGDRASILSIIDEPGRDPHSYEADARVRLELARADIVIENGGGYDDFVDTLLAGAGNQDAVVLSAVREFGISAEPPGPDFNEHVWYDLPTMASLAQTLADALAEKDAAHAGEYRANAEQFVTSVEGLEQRVAAIAVDHSGERVAITEPVPLYLLDAAGLVDATPQGFSEAIEEGIGVAPDLLAEMLDLMASGTVAALVYNEQTTGPETERILAAAQADGVPVVRVAETLPAGVDYLHWMSATVDALVAALS
jgi:zinc/manganese transport system substrate-binding protein